jgi:hypothetical protein
LHLHGASVLRIGEHSIAHLLVVVKVSEH